MRRAARPGGRRGEGGGASSCARLQHARDPAAAKPSSSDMPSPAEAATAPRPGWGPLAARSRHPRSSVPPKGARVCAGRASTSRRAAMAAPRGPSGQLRRVRHGHGKCATTSSQPRRRDQWAVSLPNGRRPIRSTSSRRQSTIARSTWTPTSANANRANSRPSSGASSTTSSSQDGPRARVKTYAFAPRSFLILTRARRESETVSWSRVSSAPTPTRSSTAASTSRRGRRG